MLQVLLFILGVIAGAIYYVIFWCEIEPTLNRLGHKFNIFSFKFMHYGIDAIREYKTAQIAAGKPLTKWWVFWGSFWTMIFVWLTYATLIIQHES